MTILKRVSVVDERDVLASSSAGVQRLATYFKVIKAVPRREIIQQDGVHIIPGVVWTQVDYFVGFVSHHELI